MGDVYEATEIASGRTVAIKLLQRQHCKTSGEQNPLKERFLTEAKATAKVSHPNVMAVYDYEVYTDNIGVDRPFMVLERLYGRDLSTIQKERGVLDWKAARPLLLQLCEGMAAVHEQGILHRDLKPQNVFVVPGRGEEKIVKILDLGLAKIRGDETAQKTQTDLFMGTAQYAAPEQIFNKSIVGPCSDIYSVGVIMYRMMTGEFPFNHEDPANLILLRQKDEFKLPSKIRPDFPKDVEAIILKAMKWNTKDRYRSMTELHDAIYHCEGLSSGMRSGSEYDHTSSEVEVPHAVASELMTLPGLSHPPERRGSRSGIIATTLTVAALAVGGYFAWPKYAPLLQGMNQPVQPSAVPSSSTVPQEQQTFKAKITSIPSGAGVYRREDNQFLGTTPLELDMAPGEHRIMVSHRGYADEVVTLSPAHREEEAVLKAKAHGGIPPAKPSPSRKIREGPAAQEPAGEIQEQDEDPGL